MSGGTLIDLLTYQEAKSAIGAGVNDETNADLLAVAITAVSHKLADVCGTIINGTVTAELHHGGGQYIYLDHSPVALLGGTLAAVTQVVEYSETVAATLTRESTSSLPADGYVVNPNNGKILRRSSGATSRFPMGYENIRVDYVAGRCANTAAVSEKFKLAAAWTLKNGWRAFEAANVTLGEFEVPQASFPTFAIPNAVKVLLGVEWRAGSGIGD